MIDAKYESGERMSPFQLKEEAVNFLIAGAETTSTLMSWLVYELVSNPEVLEKCIEEVDLVLSGEDPTYENLKQLPYLESCVYEGMCVYTCVCTYDCVGAEGGKYMANLMANSTFSFVHHDVIVFHLF
jgi:cytochrome P450